MTSSPIIFPLENAIQSVSKLREISMNDKFNYPIGKSKTNKFANGEVIVNILESVRNRVVVFYSMPKTHTDMFELFSAIDAAKRASAKEVIAIIPCLPYSRQERRPNGVRTSISSRLFADLLQTSGLDRLITMDVHASSIEGFYKIPVDNLTAQPTVSEFINRLDIAYDIVVSPDFGAVGLNEKYKNSLNIPEMAVISKKRLKPNQVDEMQLIGDVNGKRVVIFDDIIDTGGTLIKAAKLLKGNGASSIDVYATHGIFSNFGNSKLREDGNIDNVVVTNTYIPSVSEHYTIDINGEIYNSLRKILNE